MSYDARTYREVPDGDPANLPSSLPPLVTPYSEFFAARAKARFNNTTDPNAEAVERFCAWLEEKGWS